MPLLGAHMSIAGGLYTALLRGKASGCSAIQLFTSNRNQWERKKPTAEDINAFQRAAERTSVKPVAVHTSYLINLASARKEVLEKSYHALLDELEMAELLAVPYIVIHPGSHLGEGESKGLRRVAAAISRASGSRELFNTKILLETTSGQGTNLGYRFEHLAEIIALAGYPDRMGVCFDTCHAFAAGYDFRSMQTYEQLLSEFDRIIGLNRLYLFHVNDSKSPIGSRLDRHEHIGKGHIGLKAFSFFLHDPRFAHLPFLLETPKGGDPKGKDMDVRNLQTLRNLLKRADKK
jgi:deoxyribonuclease-4